MLDSKRFRRGDAVTEKKDCFSALPETPLLTWSQRINACVTHPTWTWDEGSAPDDNAPEVPERQRKRKRRGGGGRGKRRSPFSLPLSHNNKRRASVGKAAAEWAPGREAGRRTRVVCGGMERSERGLRDSRPPGLSVSGRLRA